MIEAERISEAVELLRGAANPRKIIVFGSYATGDADDDSDIDLLIVEEGVQDPMAEMVRLARVLGPTRIPVDVIVVSREHYEYWLDTPGNLMYEAKSHGKVLYEAA